jgi:hypothetical protein
VLLLAFALPVLAFPAHAYEMFSTPKKAVGETPSDLIEADFNRDGMLDLAVANRGSGDISILLGDGGGGFTLRGTYFAGGSPRSIKVGDFDDDGFLDLVVASSLGYDSGGLTLQGEEDAAVPGTIGVAEYAEAGTPIPVQVSLAQGNDVVKDVLLLPGVGDGSFRQTMALRLGCSPIRVAVEDVDADGHEDLLVVNDGRLGVGVFLGRGDGGFTPHQVLHVNERPIWLDLVDFDGDTVVDLVTVLRDSPRLSVSPGEGGGSFGTPVAVPGGRAPNSVTAADVNGDGHPDLITTIESLREGGIEVFLGVGNGTFDPPLWSRLSDYYYPGDAFASAVRDLDRDGIPDLVVQSDVWLAVMRGSGDGLFSFVETLRGMFDPRGIVVEDFDADGRLDIGSVDAGAGEVQLYLGAPGGGFMSQGVIEADISSRVARTGDLDGDGSPDLITRYTPPYVSAGQAVEVHLNDGAGRFERDRSYQVGATAFLSTGLAPMAIGDLNGDLHPDLITSNTLDYSPDIVSDLSVLIGQGDGSFQPQRLTKVGNLSGPVATADLDVLPGDEAVVMVGARLRIFRSDPDGRLTALTTVTDPNVVLAFEIGDFNGDQLNDLAYGNEDGVGVLLGGGDGTFALQAAAPIQGRPASAARGDFNGDGKLDMAIGLRGDPLDEGGDILIYLGRGDGTFDQPLQHHFSEAPDAIRTGDLDGDGALDLVILAKDDAFAYYVETIAVFLGRGDGSFAEGGRFAAQGLQARSLQIDDLDGDGRLDLLAVTERGPFMLLNRGPDADADGDGQPDMADGCTDRDGDGFGDPGYPANICLPDNCPAIENPMQGDADHDGRGDLCDRCPLDGFDDLDRDGFCADADNCPGQPNAGQADGDGDGIGDACDPCVDSDFDGYGTPGFPASGCPRDNCPNTPNPDQADADQDGFGDVCEPLGFEMLFPGAVLQAGSAPVELAAGDFNQDQIADLLTINISSDDVSLFLSKGDGSIEPERRLAVGGRPRYALCGDFDQDQLLDVAVVGGGASGLLLMIGQGDGTFSFS